MNGDQITPPGLGRQAPGHAPISRNDDGKKKSRITYCICVRKTVT